MLECSCLSPSEVVGFFFFFNLVYSFVVKSSSLRFGVIDV
jgi:hypothetical protein